MRDIFERCKENMGPLGKHASEAEGYYVFPKLTGELGPRMNFDGKEVINWSINDYLGLANHPEVRQIDTNASKDWGLAYPMGSRMMSGNSDHHDQLEVELANFVKKESVVLLNFGYQGIMSAIDSLITRRDVVVYDAECHACIIDGLRMHLGKRYSFKHNDINSLRKHLVKATNLAKESNGGILVITEGVYGMQGDQGKLKEIVALKEEFQFRLVVDDAHGFGTLGQTGAGAGEEQGVQQDIDLYFATFAKSMASIGAFIAAEKEIIKFLKYNMRSQIFAKSLPMPYVIGNLKRLQLLKENPKLKDKLWENVNKLQNELKQAGFNLGNTNSCVTPVFLNGNVNEAMKLVYDLRENYHIFCSIVIYPVIPKDLILLRLIPTALHSLEDIDETVVAFKSIKDKLICGEYAK
jgi:glycine C-acetyltransferase